MAYVPLGDVSYGVRTPGPDGELLRKNLRAFGQFLALGRFAEPQLLNGWKNLATAAGSDTDLVGYAIDVLGIVHLRGVATAGTVSATVPMFVLPKEFRPAHSKVFSVDSNYAYGKCVVDSGGRVFPEIGSNIYFSLDGLTFRALGVP